MTYTEVLKGITDAAHACIVTVIGFLLYATQYIETGWLQLGWALVFIVLLYGSYRVRDKIIDWLDEKVYFER